MDEDGNGADGVGLRARRHCVLTVGPPPRPVPPALGNAVAAALGSSDEVRVVGTTAGWRPTRLLQVLLAPPPALRHNNGW